MNEAIPEICPLCKDLKHWKNRNDFTNIKKGGEFGYHLCELRSFKATIYSPPSEWIFGVWYCFGGKYLDCPLFSEWFWDKVIKNSRIKMKKR